MSNSHVAGFTAEDKNVQFFPRGLEQIFKNIKVICINKCQLKDVRQHDLKQFNQLQYLSLEYNDIEILEANLFKYNPELQLIRFHDNKLVHIDANVFNNLWKLVHLELRSNPCISLDANNDRSAMQNIAEQLESKCKSAEFTTLEDKFGKLEEEIFTTKSENFAIFEAKLKNFEIEFNNSTIGNVSSLNARLQTLLQWRPPIFDFVNYKFNLVKQNLIGCKSELTMSLNEPQTSQDQKFSIIDEKMSNQSKTLENRPGPRTRDIEQPSLQTFQTV